MYPGLPYKSHQILNSTKSKTKQEDTIFMLDIVSTRVAFGILKEILVSLKNHTFISI